jgi:hypothetical protein
MYKDKVSTNMSKIFFFINVWHKSVFDIYFTELDADLTTVLSVLFKYCCKYCYSDSLKLWAVMKGGDLALWNLIQPTISLEMPVPSQGHYGFHSFLVVDWFCLFIYLWVLTFPLLDCSEFGNFVITLISLSPIYFIENHVFTKTFLKSHLTNPD